MKKLMVVLAAMAFVMVMVGGAYAAPSVDVTAHVKKVCTNTVDGAFTELEIDPSGGIQSFAVATQPTIQCTKNLTTTQITAASTNGSSNGTPVVCNGTGNYLTGFTMVEPVSSQTIDYSFACLASVTGLGIGTAGDGSHDVSLGVAAEVLAADAAAADYADGGVYADTVTLTVTY